MDSRSEACAHVSNCTDQHLVLLKQRAALFVHLCVSFSEQLSRLLLGQRLFDQLGIGLPEGTDLDV